MKAEKLAALYVLIVCDRGVHLIIIRIPATLVNQISVLGREETTAQTLFPN